MRGFECRTARTTRTPIVVTHPSTLFHNGLRQLFAKSRFRPVRIATSLTEELESYLGSVDGCVWLTGVERCVATTNALIRKVISANPRVKAIILAATQKPEDIAAALRAGACGFLCQDLPGETLLRSVELIAHGEMIVHPQLAWSKTPSADEFSALDAAAYVTTNGKPRLAQRFQAQSSLPRVDVEVANEDQTSDVPSLSRREMLILRMLMQGSSNKVIARNLVITEVHREGAHEGHPAKTASTESYAGGDMGAQQRQRSRLEPSGGRWLSLPLSAAAKRRPTSRRSLLALARLPLSIDLAPLACLYEAMFKVEVVVVGAGVIGLAIARALALCGRQVVLLEKEGSIGTGTSSRNSEVIHSGIYYEPESLKARLCVEGRRALYRYCEERGVPHCCCGKLVVAPVRERTLISSN